MSSALALVHVAFEDLGTLGEVLDAAGFSTTLCDVTTVDWSGLDPLASDLLVVLGGPIGVYEQDAYPFLRDEIAFVQRRLAAKLPTIGICLGAQLMAAALGASVHPGVNGKELGWFPLQAGTGIRATDASWQTLFSVALPVLHWHGDTFDLPPGARHLAASGRYPNQAFCLENYGLALQFHLEVTAVGLERWYVGHAGELAQIRQSVTALRADSHRNAPALAAFAQAFWRSWLAEALPN